LPFKSQFAVSGMCESVPAPDFQSGERVFKPARTLYLALIGL
jgi:hypothetical protein